MVCDWRTESYVLKILPTLKEYYQRSRDNRILAGRTEQFRYERFIVPSVLMKHFTIILVTCQTEQSVYSMTFYC